MSDTRPIVVKFPYKIDGMEEMNIIASAKEDRITPCGVEGLSLRFFDENMKDIVVEFNQSLFDDLEQMASELLIEEKFTGQVGF